MRGRTVEFGNDIRCLVTSVVSDPWPSFFAPPGAGVTTYRVLTDGRFDYESAEDVVIDRVVRARHTRW